MKGVVLGEKVNTLDEYCHFILGQGAVLPNSLILPFRDVKTKTSLLESIPDIMDIAMGPSGKDYDARTYLRHIIFKLMDTKGLYEGYKVDEKITRLYQVTSDMAKKQKSPCPSFTACYEIILNLCMIYSNTVQCKKNNEKCIRAVCTEIDIQAMQMWMDKLLLQMDKVSKKHGKMIKNVNLDGSVFKRALQIPSILSLVPVIKEIAAYWYMMSILSATVTRNEEIKEEKGYVW